MLLTVLFLFVGFVLLVKGAGFLIDGASSLARRFHVSELVIGLTVIAFGTSLPELVINILSNVRGLGPIGFGNIIGANIADLLLVTGIAAIVAPFAIRSTVASRDIPMAFLAAIIFTFVVNDGLISRGDAVLLLLVFAGYLFLLFRVPHTSAPEPCASWPKTIVWLVAGFLGLVAGGELVVQASSALVRSLGVSEALIGLTVVSIGSTMPELLVSVVASFRRKSQIAIGNAVGSVIFNTLVIFGLSSLVRPLSYPGVFNVDVLLLFLVLFAYVLVLLVGERHRMTRREGFVLVSLYAVFLLFTVWRG